MVYRSIEDLLTRARSGDAPKRMAVAGAGEAHTIQAVVRAKRDSFAEPVLVGPQAEVVRVLEEAGERPGDYRIVDAPEDRVAQTAVALVRGGEADFLMKGNLQTATLLKAVLSKEDGLRDGSLLSHHLFLQIPGYHKLLAVTDSAINISPGLEQKKGILENSLRAMGRLGYGKVKTAALSHVETVNPKVQESVDAATLREMSRAGAFPNCILEGPISFDLAFDPESAAVKGFESPICGDADLLLVPNIAAGNILVKALKTFAKSIPVGIALGAKTPIVLTSRGTTVEGKYNSIALGAAMA